MVAAIVPKISSTDFAFLEVGLQSTLLLEQLFRSINLIVVSQGRSIVLRPVFVLAIAPIPDYLAKW